MSNIIEELEQRIAAECKTINREERFNDMLDELFSFDCVGGPFGNMVPSRVLLEMDPTAHRCGVNDWADGQEWTEVGGETYENDDIDKIKEDLMDELDSKISDLESEIEDLEKAIKDEETGFEQAENDLEEKKQELESVQADLKELKKHSF